MDSDARPRRWKTPTFAANAFGEAETRFLDPSPPQYSPPLRLFDTDASTTLAATMRELENAWSQPGTAVLQRVEDWANQLSQKALGYQRQVENAWGKVSDAVSQNRQFGESLWMKTGENPQFVKSLLGKLANTQHEEVRFDVPETATGEPIRCSDDTRLQPHLEKIIRVFGTAGPERHQHQDRYLERTIPNFFQMVGSTARHLMQAIFNSIWGDPDIEKGVPGCVIQFAALSGAGAALACGASWNLAFLGALSAAYVSVTASGLGKFVRLFSRTLLWVFDFIPPFFGAIREKSLFVGHLLSLKRRDWQEQSEREFLQLSPQALISRESLEHDVETWKSDSSAAELSPSVEFAWGNTSTKENEPSLQADRATTAQKRNSGIDSPPVTGRKQSNEAQCQYSIASEVIHTSKSALEECVIPRCEGGHVDTFQGSLVSPKEFHLTGTHESKNNKKVKIQSSNKKLIVNPDSIDFESLNVRQAIEAFLRDKLQQKQAHTDSTEAYPLGVLTRMAAGAVGNFSGNRP
jgi:hypothetical protein